MVNSEWLQHAHSVCQVYEMVIIGIHSLLSPMLLETSTKNVVMNQNLLFLQMDKFPAIHNKNLCQKEHIN